MESAMSAMQAELQPKASSSTHINLLSQNFALFFAVNFSYCT
jgi:hypothetical protein